MKKSTSSDVVIPKSNIRQLIKVSKTQSKKIDHPHARYNQLGRISCILCGVQIKSEFAWNAHILSKTHTQNEIRGLAGKKHSLSNQGTNDSDSNTNKPKILKSDSNHDNSNNTNSLNSDYALSAVKTMPNDFFEDSALSKLDEKNPAEKSSSIIYSNSKIPEGFFDDAYKDAKVRNVPYKDKLTDELELFQKEMISLEMASEKIMEKESEDLLAYRDLEEINEQMCKWEKIKHLECQKELFEMRRMSKTSDKNMSVSPNIDGGNSNKVPSLIQIKKEENETCTSSDDDEFDINEIDNFRLKNTA